MQIPHVRAGDIDTNTMPALDVRKHPGKEQIRGAVRYDPKALLGDERLVLPLPQDRRVVVYGDDDETAEAIAAKLIDRGYQAAVLDGGFDAYKAADLPVEGITQEQPIPGDESTGIKRG